MGSQIADPGINCECRKTTWWWIEDQVDSEFSSDPMVQQHTGASTITACLWKAPR